MLHNLSLTDEAQLVQEEQIAGEFTISHPPICHPCLNLNPTNQTAKEQTHRQHIEWLREIRLSLLPLFVSCAIFILLIRSIFLIRDVESMIKFLQIVVGLFGASAGGYAYAQIRFPTSSSAKIDSGQTKTIEADEKQP